MSAEELDWFLGFWTACMMFIVGMFLGFVMGHSKGRRDERDNIRYGE